MSEIKIKTLPRSTEKPASEHPAQESRLMGRLMILLSLSAFVVGALGLWSSGNTPVPRDLAKAPKIVDRLNASVNRHMADTHMKEDMMRRKRELENRATAPRKLQPDPDLLPDDTRSYGVQLDQDDSAERLYEQLNGNRPSYGDNLEEKINQRLANRKWLNEQERAERITFVKNFIRQAYDRGYEVQIDSNLIVTGVRRIEHPKQFNIEQVLEKVAKQGQ
jgi:hypothetical protein